MEGLFHLNKFKFGGVLVCKFENIITYDKKIEKNKVIEIAL